MDISGTKEPGAQGTPEWLFERVGFCTGSRFMDVLDVLKSGKPSAKNIAYCWELVSERLTGNPTVHYVNGPMERGAELEPLAKQVYEARTGAFLADSPFIHHPTIEWVGCSPDGMIDHDGGIEVKCPAVASRHLECFTTDAMPEQHMPQVQGFLWVTGRQWCDFISYHPDFHAGLDLFIKRIARDDKYIADLESKVIAFLAQVDELHKRLAERIK